VLWAAFVFNGLWTSCLAGCSGATTSPGALSKVATGAKGAMSSFISGVTRMASSGRAAPGAAQGAKTVSAAVPVLSTGSAGGAVLVAAAPAPGPGPGGVAGPAALAAESGATPAADDSSKSFVTAVSEASMSCPPSAAAALVSACAVPA
jgi:hypothetical protein